MGPQPVNQIRDGQQALGSEGAPARRDDHERSAAATSVQAAGSENNSPSASLQ